MEELKNYVSNFGLGLSVVELVSKCYWSMKAVGHGVCILNDRYLIMDGVAYQFIKSKKDSCWKVKEIA